MVGVSRGTAEDWLSMDWVVEACNDGEAKRVFEGGVGVAAELTGLTGLTESAKPFSTWPTALLTVDVDVGDVGDDDDDGDGDDDKEEEENESDE